MFGYDDIQDEDETETKNNSPSLLVWIILALIFILICAMIYFIQREQSFNHQKELYRLGGLSLVEHYERSSPNVTYLVKSILK